MEIEEQQLYSLEQVELVADQKNLGKGKLLLTSQYVLLSIEAFRCASPLTYYYYNNLIYFNFSNLFPNKPYFLDWIQQ